MGDSELNLKKQKQDDVIMMPAEKEQDLFGAAYLRAQDQVVENNQARGLFGKKNQSATMTRVRNAAGRVADFMDKPVPENEEALELARKELKGLYEELILSCRDYQDKHGSAHGTSNKNRHRAVLRMLMSAEREHSLLMRAADDMKDRLASGKDLEETTWQDVFREVRTIDLTKNPNVSLEQGTKGGTNDLMILKIRSRTDEKDAEGNPRTTDIYFKKAEVFKPVDAVAVLREELVKASDALTEYGENEDLAPEEVKNRYSFWYHFEDTLLESGLGGMLDNILSRIAAYGKKAFDPRNKNSLISVFAGTPVSRYLRTVDPERAWSYLAPFAKDFNRNLLGMETKTPEGTTTAEKNAGVSIFSEIYGNQKQVAQCALMKVKDENGKTVKGFALETVKGKTLAEVKEIVDARHKALTSGDHGDFEKAFLEYEQDMLIVGEATEAELEEKRAEYRAEFREEYVKEHPDAGILEEKYAAEYNVVFTVKAMIQMQEQHMFDIMTGDVDKGNSGNVVCEDLEINEEKHSIVIKKVKFIDHDMAFGTLSVDEMGQVLNGIPLEHEGKFTQPFMMQETYERVMGVRAEEVKMRMGHLFESKEILKAMIGRIKTLQKKLRKAVKDGKCTLCRTEKEYVNAMRQAGRKGYVTYWNNPLKKAVKREG